MSKYKELEFDPEVDITYLQRLKQELYELRKIDEILDDEILSLKTRLKIIDTKFKKEDTGSFEFIKEKGFKARKIGVVTNAKKLS